MKHTDLFFKYITNHNYITINWKRWHCTMSLPRICCPVMRIIFQRFHGTKFPSFWHKSNKNGCFLYMLVFPCVSSYKFTSVWIHIFGFFFRVSKLHICDMFFFNAILSLRLFVGLFRKVSPQMLSFTTQLANLKVNLFVTVWTTVIKCAVGNVPVTPLAGRFPESVNPL